jgi:hypothetical protein
MDAGHIAERVAKGRVDVAMVVGAGAADARGAWLSTRVAQAVARVAAGDHLRTGHGALPSQTNPPPSPVPIRVICSRDTANGL